MIDHGYGTNEVLRVTQFSKATLCHTQCHKCTTGTVAKAVTIGCGRPRLLGNHDVLFLIQLSCHNPALFLDEYVKRLYDGCFIGISLTTVHQSFERAGINVKHIQKVAAEQNSLIQADFICCIGQYSPASLLFLDEVSKDDWTYSCLTG
ncbi:hypothetical protein BS17DRAFT_692150 [Gyrodon lividus]|nr:hypothetical protein BS17DRAFT_692150 [Gyrodon lividus]